MDHKFHGKKIPSISKKISTNSNIRSENPSLLLKKGGKYKNENTFRLIKKKK